MFHQSSEKMPVKFKDVTACFSVEEWKLLHEREKLFYRSVMEEVHQALIMLGYHILNPETLLRVITCVYQEDLKNPESGADLHDPTSSHDPATDPTPDILLRIEYKEEQISRALQRSEEREIGIIPSTDFPLQIQEEEEPGSMGSEGREALACDPGHWSIHPETLLHISKWEYSAHLDAQDSKSQPDLDESISSISPPSEAVLRIQQEQEQCSRDAASPEERKMINSPGTAHNPATDPSPGIFIRIQYKEEQSSRDLQSSEEIEIASVPMTSPPMATTDISVQIKEEEEPGSMGSEGREALACDPGNQNIHSETLLQTIKGEDSGHVDGQDSEGQADFDETTSSHHPAISTPCKGVLRSQQEQELCSRDAASPQEDRKICWSPDTANGCLVKTESLQTTPRILNIQREKRNLTDEEHEQSKELIKKLVHSQNSQIPWASVECEQQIKDHTRDRPLESTEFENTFSELSSLKVHHKIHAGVKPLKCTECEKHFTKLSSLKRHHRIHTREKPYECTECRKSFHSSNALKSHQRHIHGRGKPHECNDCMKSFSTSSALRNHQRTHTGERPFKCTECEKGYFNMCSLKVHERIHTGEKPYVCSKCKKSFRDTTTLKMHCRIHTGEKPYECTVCKKIFTRVSALKKHQRIHTGEKPYSCSECNKSFRDSSTLNIHFRIHTGEKLFECRECKKCFRSSSDLRRHQRTHTGKKPYECTWCKKIFTRLSSLKMHYRIHTGEKPFECKECKECFRCAAYLKVHQRVHTGEKPYECTRCKKIFSHLSIMTEHYRIHTGEKPFQCRDCKKCFRRSSDLKVHQNVHTGEKPNECTMSKKVFAQSSVVKTHHRIYSSEKPFKCKKCKKCFTFLSYLKMHQRTHIGDKP